MIKCYVLGGANIDIIAKSNNKLIEFDSNPGQIKLTFGGVGRNVAENIVKQGIDVYFKSIFSSDLLGQLLYEKCKKDFDLSYSRIVDNKNTSCYVAILNQSNDMSIAISDMEILDLLTVDEVICFINNINENDWLIIDGNLRQEFIDVVFANKKFNIAVDPISVNKCHKFNQYLNKIDLIKPNNYEAKAILGDSDITDAMILEAFKKAGVAKIFVSMGENGLLYFDEDKKCQMKVAQKIQVCNATGAGDACLGSLVASIIKGYDAEKMVKLAIASSIMTLECEDSVCQNINDETLDVLMNKLIYIKEEL